MNSMSPKSIFIALAASFLMSAESADAPKPVVIPENRPSLLVNGDFKSVETNGRYLRIPDGELLGWYGAQAEQGKGEIYNSAWPKGTIVIELDAEENYRLRQDVKLKGYEKYELSFDWAIRDKVALQQAELLVSWNESQPTRLKLTDYGVHRANIIVWGHHGVNTLEFRGVAAGGSTVTNVMLQPFPDDCGCFDE